MVTKASSDFPSWVCLDCQFAPGVSLCRMADGAHTFERLARAYLSSVVDEQYGNSDERHRAFDCVSEMVRATPAAAVGFLVVACAQCATLAQLCVVAAGPLEDLLEAHGHTVIGQLETIAKVDPKFRLLLSGTWGQARIEAAVWSRLVAAVAPGPVLDKDQRTPGGATKAALVTDDQVAQLFAADQPKGARVHHHKGGSTRH